MAEGLSGAKVNVKIRTPNVGEHLNYSKTGTCDELFWKLCMAVS